VPVSSVFAGEFRVNVAGEMMGVTVNFVGVEANIKYLNTKDSLKVCSGSGDYCSVTASGHGLYIEAVLHSLLV